VRNRACHDVSPTASSPGHAVVRTAHRTYLSSALCCGLGFVEFIQHVGLVLLVLLLRVGENPDLRRLQLVGARSAGQPGGQLPKPGGMADEAVSF
jgi:hypothetical protein